MYDAIYCFTLQQCLPLAVLKRRSRKLSARPKLSLQQCLPLAVLKRVATNICFGSQHVATVLTACGIETIRSLYKEYTFLFVATVLTACGIETWKMYIENENSKVATVLTACGIETF